MFKTLKMVLCDWTFILEVLGKTQRKRVSLLSNLNLGTEKVFLLQIQPNQPLDEMSIACILRDLLHAVEYLHNEGKIHRDIKGFLIYSLT